MSKKRASDVSIGKFDILATYTYAKAVLDGAKPAEAKERGMVAAVMGAKARRSPRGEGAADRAGQAEEKESTIDAGSFDRQVRRKMGEFFESVFLPAMKQFVEAGYSYDDVKRVVKMPTTWGAKLSGEQFRERCKHAFAPKRPKGHGRAGTP